MRISERFAVFAKLAAYRLFPVLTDLIVFVATYVARRRLKGRGRLDILIDGTVLYHSILHETGWVSTGAQSWGGIPIDSGYMARIPVHGDSSDREIMRNVRYLPGIKELHRLGLIKLWTSRDLHLEQFVQPAGRYHGYGWYDYGIFRDIEIESIDGYDFGAIAISMSSGEELKKIQRSRIGGFLCDASFAGMVRILGNMNSQDIWHYYTAEKNGMFCYMTMDFKFVRNCHAQRNRKELMGMSALVLSPAELGKILRILPVSPRIYAYNDASFPVEIGGEMDGGRRAPLKKYKR